MGELIVWNLHDDIEKYQKYIQQCMDKTPYHLTEYLLAEENAEDGHTRIFLYAEKDSFAMLPCVIRVINRLTYMSDLKEEVFDMITPHEYGGIISNKKDITLKQALLVHVIDYCKVNKIIYQFHRLNPFLEELPELYKKADFEVIYSNSQVYVDLEKSKEQIECEYKSNVRRNVKRAVKEELRFEIAEKSKENIAIFQNMYQKAMEILQAKRFLYFNAMYFFKMIHCTCAKLAFVKTRENKVIAASIMLVSRKTVYYHLGCFDREYSLYRPMNYLMHSMILWSKQEGYKTFHLGGGGKSLLQFKEGYSNTRIDYYVANKICNKDEYREICARWKEKFPQYKEENYYPLYRYNE